MPIKVSEQLRLLDYARITWEAEGSVLHFSDWLRCDKEAAGIVDLKQVSRDEYFHLIHHYINLLEAVEYRKITFIPSGSPRR